MRADGTRVTSRRAGPSATPPAVWARPLADRLALPVAPITTSTHERDRSGGHRELTSSLAACEDVKMMLVGIVKLDGAALLVALGVLVACGDDASSDDAESGTTQVVTSSDESGEPPPEPMPAA